MAEETFSPKNIIVTGGCGFIAGISKIAGVERVSYPALMAERLHATVGKCDSQIGAEGNSHFQASISVHS